MAISNRTSLDLSKAGVSKGVSLGANFNSQLDLSIPARTNKTVFVDLDDKPAKANVVRDGYRVPSVQPDNNRLEALLSGMEILQPTRIPRVLDQSIAAGTRVSVGTEIDLILAPREDVIIGIFDDIHIAVKDQSVSDLLARVQDQTQLKDLVLKYDNANDVEENDKIILTQLMGEVAGMPISEGKAGQGFSNGFNSMRAALAFK